MILAVVAVVRFAVNTMAGGGMGYGHIGSGWNHRGWEGPGYSYDKLDLDHEYFGEHKPKNIVEPLRVYRTKIEPVVKRKEKRVGLRWWQWAALAVVLILITTSVTKTDALAIWNNILSPASPPVEVASVEKVAFPLPDNVNKPSIAVLPFVNMGDDPKQEYFSDPTQQRLCLTGQDYKENRGSPEGKINNKKEGICFS